MLILRRRGGLTAKELGRICACRASKNYLPRKRNFVINYGRDYEYADLNKNVIFNKLKVYELLNQAGVSQPRMFYKGDIIPDNAFPLLARKKYHSQGRDIIYIANREQLENELKDFMYDFLVEYIHKTSEYRVHILGDKAFVSVKFNRDGDGDPIIRSHKNKWKQIEYNGEWKESLFQLATEAIKVMKYDFGAIDIIRKGSKLYVLEINTAPGLEPRKLKIYANYFKEEEEKWNQNSR